MGRCGPSTDVSNACHRRLASNQSTSPIHAGSGHAAVSTGARHDERDLAIRIPNPASPGRKSSVRAIGGSFRYSRNVPVCWSWRSSLGGEAPSAGYRHRLDHPARPCVWPPRGSASRLCHFRLQTGGDVLHHQLIMWAGSWFRMVQNAITDSGHFALPSVGK